MNRTFNATPGPYFVGGTPYATVPCEPGGPLESNFPTAGARRRCDEERAWGSPRMSVFLRGMLREVRRSVGAR